MNARKLFTPIAFGAAIHCGGLNAATLDVPDFSSAPDGSTSVNEQNNALGSTVLPTGGTSQMFMVTTFNFGVGSNAHIAAHFAASTTAWQDRLGAIINDDGLVQVYGGGGLQNTPNPLTSQFNLAQDMAGQSVTLLIKYDYNVNRSTTNNDDTLMEVWVNPTSSSLESSADLDHVWNSASFPGFVQRIENQGTPGTAGASSITGTRVFTGVDANFATALAFAAPAAVIPEPSSLALIGLGFGGLLLRRRR